jgi:hypothetical protein
MRRRIGPACALTASNQGGIVPPGILALPIVPLVRPPFGLGRVDRDESRRHHHAARSSPAAEARRMRTRIAALSGLRNDCWQLALAMCGRRSCR